MTPAFPGAERLSVAEAADPESAVQSSESQAVRESAEDPRLLLNQDRLIRFEDPGAKNNMSVSLSRKRIKGKRDSRNRDREGDGDGEPDFLRGSDPDRDRQLGSVLELLAVAQRDVQVVDATEAGAGGLFDQQLTHDQQDEQEDGHTAHAPAG